MRCRAVTTLYVLVGLPGSGKSSWARASCGRLDAVVVGSDQIRRELRADGQDFFHDDLVFAEVERRARSLLEAGRSVILDATHYERRYRTYIFDVTRGLPVDRVAIWLAVPLAICLEQNSLRSSATYGERPMPEDFVRCLHDLFEPPGLDEFDEVVRVTV